MELAVRQEDWVGAAAANNSLGTLLYMLGDYQRSLDIWRIGLSFLEAHEDGAALDANLTREMELTLRNNIASAYESRGHYESSIAEYSVILERDPRPQVQEETRLWRGLALLEMEEYELAVNDLLRSGDIAREKDVALNHALCWALANSSSPTKALNWCEIAASEEPDRSTVQDSYGFALLNAGEVQRALPVLQEAVRLDANNAWALLHLADTYHALEQPDERDEALKELSPMLPYWPKVALEARERYAVQ